MNDSAPGDGQDVRTVLRAWEAEGHGEIPGFEVVQRRLARSPSPMEPPRWGATRSAHLAWSLARAQVLVVPWAIVPVALVMAAMAVLAARFFGVAGGGEAAESAFASVLLMGVVVTMTAAVSPAGADALTLATPLGPRVVVLARVTAVLVVDSVFALAGSGMASRYASSPSSLVASWLVPLALVAGVSAFVAIWVAPWAGVVMGLVIAPMSVPISGMVFSLGLGGLLWRALPPAGLVAVGLVVLAACVVSARHAAENRLLLA